MGGILTTLSAEGLLFLREAPNLGSNAIPFNLSFLEVS